MSSLFPLMEADGGSSRSAGSRDVAAHEVDSHSVDSRSADPRDIDTHSIASHGADSHDAGSDVTGVRSFGLHIDSARNASAVRLDAVLREMVEMSATGEVAVAVSGGVDSLTLATFAHRTMGNKVIMYHAVSPAVPPVATERTRALAQQEGWRLEVVDAGEFSSDEYLRNPANRCYFCKTSLYGSVTRHTRAQVVSGTNTDDLGDYRPGLMAAKEHTVRHPFVEAGMSKQAVRELARELGLPEIAELPSSPCLSSRVETGIAIDPKILRAIDDVEQYLRATLPAMQLMSGNIRCRYRLRGIALELDDAVVQALSQSQRAAITQRARQAFDTVSTPVLFEAYRLGSAFLHPVNIVRR